MKRLIYLLTGVMFGMIIAGVSFAAEELVVKPNPYPIYVNGVETQVAALNINGFTYLKLGDMSKAGLEVKFNETQKRIEVTSVFASPASKGESTMGDTAMVPLNKYGLPDLQNYKGTLPKIEDDGKNQYVTFEGTKYIRLGWDKNHPAMIPESYYLWNPLIGENDDRKLQLAKSDGEGGTTILLDEIPFFSYSSRLYFIPYDYYLNTFLPAIQGAE